MKCLKGRAGESRRNDLSPRQSCPRLCTRGLSAVRVKCFKRKIARARINDSGVQLGQRRGTRSSKLGDSFLFPATGNLPADTMLEQYYPRLNCCLMTSFVIILFKVSLFPTVNCILIRAALLILIPKERSDTTVELHFRISSRAPLSIPESQPSKDRNLDISEKKSMLTRGTTGLLQNECRIFTRILRMP